MTTRGQINYSSKGRVYACYAPMKIQRTTCTGSLKCNSISLFSSALCGYFRCTSAALSCLHAALGQQVYSQGWKHHKPPGALAPQSYAQRKASPSVCPLTASNMGNPQDVLNRVLTESTGQRIALPAQEEANTLSRRQTGCRPILRHTLRPGSARPRAPCCHTGTALAAHPSPQSPAQHNVRLPLAAHISTACLKPTHQY